MVNLRHSILFTILCLRLVLCVEQFIEQLVEQAEKLTNNGNASPVGQESSAPADESTENIQSSSDKGIYLFVTIALMHALYNYLSVSHFCLYCNIW